MIEPQTCPHCGAVCKLMVQFASDDSYAVLPDRLMALGDVACTATCIQCGQVRTGIVKDLDVELETGMLKFGTIVLNA